MTDVGGTYDFTAQSPMGEQTGTFAIVPSEDGTSFTGEMASGMGTMEVENGVIDGNTLTWKMKMTTPMPMNLDCEAVVDGDAVSGKIKAGIMGSMPFTAQKQV